MKLSLGCQIPQHIVCFLSLVHAPFCLTANTDQHMRTKHTDIGRMRGNRLMTFPLEALCIFCKYTVGRVLHSEGSGPGGQPWALQSFSTLQKGGGLSLNKADYSMIANNLAYLWKSRWNSKSIFHSVLVPFFTAVANYLTKGKRGWEGDFILVHSSEKHSPTCREGCAPGAWGGWSHFGLEENHEHCASRISLLIRSGIPAPSTTWHQWRIFTTDPQQRKTSEFETWIQFLLKVYPWLVHHHQVETPWTVTH